jgi:hypothetical protein
LGGSVKPIERWRAENLADYFRKKYLDVTGKVHEYAQGRHNGIMNRYLRHTNKNANMVLKYIDAFFEIGYDSPTMETFGTSGRIGEIDTYLATGKKPYYLTAKRDKPPIEQSVKESTSESKQAFLDFISGKGGKGND